MSKESLIAIAIMVILACVIGYSIYDDTYGWNETVVFVKDKTWNTNVIVYTDGKGSFNISNVYYYYLLCDVGKMEVNPSTYNIVVTNKYYLVLSKGLRIKQLVREVTNAKAEKE